MSQKKKSVEKNDSDVRFRNACFTFQPEKSICDKKELWEEHTLNRFNKFLENLGKYKYCIVGKEICPETGRFHLQGYIEFGSQIRLSKIKKLDNESHWEIRRGTQKQAIDYCKKEKNFLEWGNPTNEQGKRNDLISLCDDIKSGKKKKDIIDEYPSLYVKNCNGVDKLLDFYIENRKDAPTFIWLFGKAGVGKTKYVFDRFNCDNIYSKSAGKWWDGYAQEDVILIDDFDKDTYEFRELLKLCDRYKYSGQVKGGFVKINSPFIFITCEFPPSHFWIGNTLTQVLRRADKIIYLDEDPINNKEWVINRDVKNAQIVGEEIRQFENKKDGMAEKELFGW